MVTNKEQWLIKLDERGQVLILNLESFFRVSGLAVVSAASLQFCSVAELFSR